MIAPTDSAAQANVRAAVPSAEAYYADNGNYTGMTIASLKANYDSGLKIAAGDHGVTLGATPTPTALLLRRQTGSDAATSFQLQRSRRRGRRGRLPVSGSNH